MCGGSAAVGGLLLPSLSLGWLSVTALSLLFHLPLFSFSNPLSDWQDGLWLHSVLFVVLMAPSLLQSPAHCRSAPSCLPALASETDRDNRPSHYMSGFAKPSMTDMQFTQPYHCSIMFDVVSVRGMSYPWLLSTVCDLLLRHYGRHCNLIRHFFRCSASLRNLKESWTNKIL